MLLCELLQGPRSEPSEPLTRSALRALSKAAWAADPELDALAVRAIAMPLIASPAGLFASYVVQACPPQDDVS